MSPIYRTLGFVLPTMDRISHIIKVPAMVACLSKPAIWAFIFITTLLLLDAAQACDYHSCPWGSSKFTLLLHSTSAPKPSYAAHQECPSSTSFLKSQIHPIETFPDKTLALIKQKTPLWVIFLLKLQTQASHLSKASSLQVFCPMSKSKSHFS